jgi:hypothetical protein
LDQAINNLLFNVHVRKDLVSDTASQLLESTQAEQVGSSVVQPSSAASPDMQGGAVKQPNS